MNGIQPGQLWTGRSGMGSDLRVKRVDLDTAQVIADHEPCDPAHPTYTSDLTDFVRAFRLKD